MKRLLGVIVVAVAILAAVIVARAGQFTPPGLTPAKATPFNPVPGAVGRLAGAVRIATVSPSDSSQRDSAAFKEMHSYLAQSFPRAHAAMSREIVGDDALLYKWQGTDSTAAPVVMMGHIDVVPVDSGALKLWAHGPFSGDTVGGYVWGRGTLDDKSTVLALFEAVESMLTTGFKPSRPVYFAFGADEEVGGEKGAAKIAALLKSRGVQPMLVLDEGGAVIDRVMPGVMRPVALVGIAEKGYTTIELTVRGEGGHSSMPPRHTAAGILARAITRLEDNPLPGQIGSETSQLFDAVGREMSFGRRMLFANRWLFDPVLRKVLSGNSASDAMLRTTTAVTMLQGSPKDNILPTVARAAVNFRIIPGETQATVVAHIRKAVDDDRVEVSPVGHQAEPSRVSPTDNAVWGKLKQAIGQVYPDAVVAPYLVLGATDSRYFRDLTPNVYRFSGARFDIEDRNRVHGINERIAIASYINEIRFFHQVIRNLTQ